MGGRLVRRLLCSYTLCMRTREELGWAFLFLLPLLWTLVVAFGYAFIRAVYFSFTEYDLFKPPSWVGLKNFNHLLEDSRFLLALSHTLVFSAIVTSVQTILALLLAVVVNQKLRGITLFRAGYYVPSISSSVVVTLIFAWLVHRRGVANFLLTALQQYALYLLVFAGAVALLHLLQLLWERWRWKAPTRFFDPLLLLTSLLGAALVTIGLHQLGVLRPRAVPPMEIAWVSTERTFLGVPLPLWSIMALNIWTTIPTFMVIFLAGLQDVPKELYEAAELDGAGSWQKLWYVTVPALRPVLFLVITLGLIGTLQMFDQVAVLAGLAPLDSIITLAYYIYWNMFGGGGLPRVGMASAAALFLALLTLAVVLLQRRFGISEKGVL